MGAHPINLAVRFMLEIFALVSIGLWGGKQRDGWLGYSLAIGIPVMLAIIWGSFAVPDDPSRSGKALIVTPGAIRLLIECGIFAFATWTLYNMGFNTTSFVFGFIVVLHYITSYDRILWLLSN